MTDKKLHSQNIVACIWDFDKTLINGYMQKPLFKRYKVDAKLFWEEVKALPEIYSKRGNPINRDTIYLNHLLSYVKNGPMQGLNNSILNELGKELEFYPGLPHFFSDLKEFIQNKPEYKKHNITLEHYIISAGLSEMIKGCAIAPFVENIYGCDFIENPIPPGFLDQPELDLKINPEISQIGNIVDNTIKTRFIFEINKGTNKNSAIDVNALIKDEDRRIPIKNMIYIADGPSDVPVFSVIKKNGGKTFAVYNPNNDKEFKQNDRLREMGRIDCYGPACYTSRQFHFPMDKNAC